MANLNNRKQLLWLPLALALAAIIGIFIGSRFPVKQQNYGNKLNSILNLIANNYVDTISVNDLVDISIPEILSNLDPHTVYLSASDLRAANDDLNGSFSGVGIQFMIMNDSITVVEVIPDGPAEKVGVLAGDRIVKINDTTFVGPKITTNTVFSHLRGAMHSKVKLGIKRKNSSQIYNFWVVRDNIPVKSVDAVYMIDDNIGYLKVNQFGRNTYDEFITALSTLKEQGAKRYIIDLRGNGGGYMETAILMANEFLPANNLIVYTKGRDRRDDSQFWSDGNGQFQEAEVVVLIDEFSASSSEVFSGALQDNDRALIMGCRSFGKGLVQKQIVLPDSSAIRLTIARYYTPAGRCIQKDYKKNGTVAYEEDIVDRFKRGELYNRDSMKVDKSKVYKTVHGRLVYGGGGIVPDIFVPIDTTGYTSYYNNIVNAGILQQFAFKYADANRQSLHKMKDYKQFLRMLPSNNVIINDFAAYAAKQGVPARWYYINISRNLIVTQIKALVARDAFGNDAYYPILNRSDRTVQAALKAIKMRKAAFPITIQQ